MPSLYDAQESKFEFDHMPSQFHW